MKNRKREYCTSGSVRDEDGNILIYLARGSRASARLLLAIDSACPMPSRTMRQASVSLTDWGGV